MNYALLKCLDVNRILNDFAIYLFATKLTRFYQI